MDPQLPLVSIVVPYYNAAPFLSETIESVINQTYRNWELILVNDGSTDESASIARDYADHWPNQIYTLAHADGCNRGLPATRNLGLRHCKGEFVAPLDSDDVWLSHKLADQVAILLQYPQVALVFGRSEYWNSWRQDGSVKCVDTVPSLAPGNKIYQPCELIFLTHPFGELGSPCPSDLMIRRTSLNEIGGFADEFQDRAVCCEDIALLSSLFLRYPIYVSNNCWDRYRLRPDSMWAEAQKNGDAAVARRFFMNWFEKHLETNKIDDSAVWKIYEKRTWQYRHPILHTFIFKVRKQLRPLRSFFREQVVSP